MPECVAEETTQRIPGLPDDYVEQNAKKAAKKKKQADKKVDEAPKEKPVPEEPKEAAPAAPAAPTVPEPEKQAEPEKRLKNVRKKLSEIEALEANPKGSLSADQQKKIQSKTEFEAEARYLEKVISGTARGMPAADAKEAAAKQMKKKGPAEAPVVPVAKPLTPEPEPAAPAAPAPAPTPAPKPKPEAKKQPKPEEPTDTADAAKRVRNVKKKLAEIERLEQNKTPLSEDQKAKVARKKELEVELRMLEKQIK